jgi:hypothetical protein
MTDSSIVVQFPSGRPHAPASPSGSRNRSIAGIVRSLAGTRRLPMDGSDEPLPIRLSEFAGIVDPTVRRLTSLACSGVITPVSAGRLALRHADELATRCPEPHASAPSAPRYALAVSGDPFGQFAIRLSGTSAWIVFAPVDSLGFLAELCPRQGIQVCMLIGCDAERRTTVRLMTSTDWRRRLVALVRRTNRCGCRHVLLLGGLPSREPERSDALTGIELALRRGGNTQLVSSSLRKRSVARTSSRHRDPSREALAMIELTFPGLVDVLVPVGEPAQ